MEIPYFQVDAFTNKIFAGNPAAVCILERWLEDEILQKIAAENNLSETAFLVPHSPGCYHLRWFTPTVEVDLCGHATLASAFIVFTHMDRSLEVVKFDTRSGRLAVNRRNDLLLMDFPARKPIPCELPAALSEALGCEPVQVMRSRDLLVVFDHSSAIATMKPNFNRLQEIQDVLGIIVTAPGEKGEFDFVSRFFAPNAGVNEDPVTGSAHCTLIPYWAERLGKKRLRAYQLSSRGGEIWCELKGDRVTIGGSAVLFALGRIYL